MMSLFGPVFHKELLELSRRPTTYYLRVLAGMGMLAVILLYTLNPTAGDAGFSTIKRQAAIGAVVFEHWMWVQFWIVCGSMPLLVCGLIAAEREAGSLELLFCTHLRDREIVLGKLASRVFFIVTLVFIGLPVLVILGLLGGIDFDQLLKVQLLTIAAALLVAAAGVYFSTVSKRPWVACLQTYGFFVFLWAFVPFTIIVGYQIYMQGQSAPTPAMPPRWFFFSLLATCAWSDVYFLCDQRGRVMVGFMLGWEGVLTFAGIWFAAAAAFFYCSVRELRTGPRKSLVGRLTALLARPFVWLARAAFGKRAADVGNKSWRPRLPNMPLFERNPIVWRNRRAEVYDPDGNLFRLQIGAWIIAALMLGLIVTVNTGGPRFNMYGFLMLEVAFLHAMIATVGASSIARERQRGSLNLLLITDLSAWSILSGTVRGVVRTCSPTIYLVAATLFASVVYESFTPHLAITYGLIIAAYSALLVIGAVFVSAAATHAGHAVTAMALVTIAHWFTPTPVAVIGPRLLFTQAPEGLDFWLVWGGLTTYCVILGSAIAICILILRGRRPIVGAAGLAFGIPAFLLQFSLLGDDGHRISSLWRWLTDLDVSYYRQSTSSWRGGNEVAETIPWFFFFSAAALLAIAVWKFNAIVGRTSRRPRQPVAKPPLIGRSISDLGSNSPIPISAPS
jgi:ABC-type transport system involved in multi-copper enzyme maturation permease subunit